MQGRYGGSKLQTHMRPCALELRHSRLHNWPGAGGETQTVLICTDKVANRSTDSSLACQRKGCWANPRLSPWIRLQRQQNSGPCFSGADELKSRLLDGHLCATAVVPVLSKLVISAVTVLRRCGAAAGHCHACYLPLCYPDCSSAEMS